MREVSAKQTEGVLLFTRPVPSRIQCRMDIYCRIRAAYGAYPGEKRVIGRSVEGRALFAFRVGEGRPLGIAVYAVHAREWVTALLALRHIRRSVPAGSVWFLPLLDPDGALLVQRGIGSIRSPRRRETLLLLNGGDDFSLWKANAEGTDLNVNFPARWGEGAKNVFSPAPANYVGECPLSAPESRALAAFTLKEKPDYALAFHTKGEEVYWHFHQPPLRLVRDYRFAHAVAASAGYPLKEAPSSSGGYKDWCIGALHIPAVTVEAGSDALSHPVGEEMLPVLAERTEGTVRAAALAAKEIRWKKNSCAKP